MASAYALACAKLALNPTSNTYQLCALGKVTSFLSLSALD